MLAWYRKMKHDEEWMRREGWLLSAPEIARNYRRELTMHFRSFFRLLPWVAFYSILGAWYQASRFQVFRRLLKRKSFDLSFVERGMDGDAVTPNVFELSDTPKGRKPEA
jgi:hypothetical protein